ncbi:MAG: outer membrane beta-barrel protein [Bacteroidota bacterium]
MTDKELDDLLKDKLGNFEADRPENAWDLFQEDLNYALSEDAAFDDALKSKLESFAISEAMPWDSFKSLMEEANDENFDQQIKTSIEEYEAPMESGSWNTFLTYFQNHAALKRKLYRTKAIEACLILLALFTFWNMQPEIKKGLEKIEVAFNRYHHHSIHNNNDTVENDNTSAILVDANANNQQQTNYHPSQEEMPVSSEAISNFSANEISESSKVNTNGLNEDTTAPNSIKPEASKTETIQLDMPTPYVAPKQNTIVVDPLKTIFPIELNQDHSNEVNPSLTSIDRTKLNLKKYPLLGDFVEDSKLVQEAFDLDAIASLDLNNFASNENSIEGFVQPLNVKRSKNVYISTQVGMDLNYIFTPYDDVYKVPSNWKTSIGHNAGVQLTFEKGRWAFEIGSNYSSKTYSPVNVEEIVGNISQGYVGVSLKDIEIQTINIPVAARYKLMHSKNWKLFGFVGASANMAIFANYYKQNTNYNNQNGTLAFASLRAADIENKDFENGILEGGNFFENIYFTANTGLNIERRISNRLSIFAQPSFNYNIFNTGLGPNHDQIHTLGFAVGTRVQLK